MVSHRIDRFLLGLGALLILFSSYQLFFKTAQSEDGLLLGKLTSISSVVKTKNALSISWRDAYSGNDLTQNQLIYTDNKSSAEVQFSKGGSLEIGENSLVKLKVMDLAQSMDLEKGFIRAKLEDDRPLKVQMNGEDYTVSGSGADIQINLQDEKGEIGVLSGEVKVEGSGVSENLNTTSALKIDGNALTKKTIYFKVMAPKKGEIRYLVEVPSATDFSWIPSEAAKLLISKSSTMDDAQVIEGLGEARAELMPGLYYYRIENEKGSSLIGQLRLVEEVAPNLLRPLSGDSVDIIQSEEASLLLQWEDEGHLSYLLEWNDGKEHAKVVKGSSALVNVSKTGIFRWRLKVMDDERPLAIWTNWQDIQLNLVTLPSLPTDLSPHEVEFQTYEAPNEKIELKWKSEHTVELEVVDPKGETETKKVAKNLEEMTATIPGTYRFRVRAVDNFLRTSEWTEWKNFLIEDLSQYKGTEGVQRIQLKKPDQAVTFSWKGSENAVNVFELAKDSQFKIIVKKMEVQKDSIQVSVPEVGSYYWRSREFLPNGTIHVSEPKRVIIEPVPAPLRPEKLPDIEIPIEELPHKTTFWQDFLSLIISSAHAEELKGQVRIKLPTKEDAKGFIVRIYRDEELRDLAYEKEISTKEFTWEEATPGTYYWQYAVIDYWNRQSLFSEPALLTIKGELTPFPVRPKLLTPIRAQQVQSEDLEFKWTSPKENDQYVIELSKEKSFKTIIIKKETRKSKIKFENLELKPQLYYWRVVAFDKKRRQVVSNTGRFVMKPELERVVISDQLVWKKKWKNRLMVSWSPSMDNYTFNQDGQEGEIDGNALMGFGISGSIFFKNTALNGELLRQSGEVFEKEEYLFQRLLFDYVYTWNKSLTHKIGLGISMGQTSGQGYEIVSGEARAESESSFGYGLVLRNYLSFNENWEMQGKILYLTGEITQIEITADALLHRKNYFFLGGVGFSTRSYSVGSGEQTSMKLTLGLGKEF